MKKKAWALLHNGRISQMVLGGPFGIYENKKDADVFVRESWRVVPCTIEFTVPKKKEREK